ncbi:MAG: RDD family protein [Verrucomicrobiae bacterium]|nr:RDD family protein [Verrucomicrobiae bacterium]
MPDWFYTDALANQQGPVDESTLLDLGRAGILKARSLVWREGLEGWIPFRNVASELYTLRKSAELDSAAADRSAPQSEAPPRVEIGVCAFSEQVYPAGELLPYGEALVGPDHKDNFVRRLMEGAAEEISDATEQGMGYVGFWWRCLSSLLDYLVKLLPSWLFWVPYYIATMSSTIKPMSDPESLEGITGMTLVMAVTYGIGVLGSLLFSVAYETWMVGRYQATLGKIMIGAKVVNPDGTRLTYKRAFVRWLAKKPLNYLILWGPSTLGFALVIGVMVGMGENPGVNEASFVLTMMSGLFVYAALLLLCSGIYWMAAFDPEKRALHDRVAATRVVKK